VSVLEDDSTVLFPIRNVLIVVLAAFCRFFQCFVRKVPSIMLNIHSVPKLTAAVEMPFPIVLLPITAPKSINVPAPNAML
jgi:hypothetical protein